MAKKSKQIVEGQESSHYESPRKKRGKQKAQLQPPMTPMIDVTFQLLIFFLVTSQYLAPEGFLPGSVPEIEIDNPVPPDQVSPTIQVLRRVTNTGLETVDYVIKPTKFEDTEDLYQWLVAHKEKYGVKDVTVTIKPDTEVFWGYAVDAYNSAVRAGFTKVAMAPIADD